MNHCIRWSAVFLAVVWSIAILSCGDDASKRLDSHANEQKEAENYLTDNVENLRLLANSTWANEVQKYMEKDALKVHVDTSTNTHVMNGKHCRAIFRNGSVNFVSIGVGRNKADQILKEKKAENRWAVRYRLTGMKYNGRVHDLGVGRTS